MIDTNLDMHTVLIVSQFCKETLICSQNGISQFALFHVWSKSEITLLWNRKYTNNSYDLLVKFGLLQFFEAICYKFIILNFSVRRGEIVLPFIHTKSTDKSVLDFIVFFSFLD